MSESVILVLLAGIVLALLLLPLLRGRGSASRPTRAGSAARDQVLPANAGVDDDPAALALREIELDREMGKLSEADYLALRAKYEAARGPHPARSASLPLADGPAATSDAASRAPGAVSGQAALQQQAESLVRRWRQQSVRCPDCGDRPEPDARYCSNCGRVVAPCPGCGSTISEPAARFCTKCGSALAA